MFGIIFGVVCLVAFVGVWRGRFRRRWHGYGGCHGGHGGGYGYGRRHGGRRFGVPFGLYRLFEELDTSPGQEKAIRSALDELRATFSSFRPRLKETRHGVAAALANETFDASAVEQALDGPMADVSRSRSAVVETIGKIHDALDADQRRRLARFIDALPPFGHAF